VVERIAERMSRMANVDASESGENA
jgi:hypothetical protein